MWFFFGFFLKESRLFVQCLLHCGGFFLKGVAGSWVNFVALPGFFVLDKGRFGLWEVHVPYSWDRFDFFFRVSG